MPGMGSGRDVETEAAFNDDMAAQRRLLDACRALDRLVADPVRLHDADLPLIADLRGRLFDRSAQIDWAWD